MPRIRAENIAVHKEQTRSEILDAAESLFVAQGYTNTALGEIADAVGVGRTTVYEYFKNKDDLLVELVEARVPPVLEGIVAGLSDDVPGAGRLGELFTRTMSFVAEHPEYGLIVTQAGRKLPREKQDRMWAALGAAAEEITRICSVGVESGEFAPGDVHLLSRCVADTFVGGMEEVLRSPDPKEHLGEVLDVWVPFLGRSLRQ